MQRPQVYFIMKTLGINDRMKSDLQILKFYLLNWEKSFLKSQSTKSFLVRKILLVRSMIYSIEIVKIQEWSRVVIFNLE